MKKYYQYRHSLSSCTTSLLLIRHGETVALEEGTYFELKNGQSDPDLHSRGYAQAWALAGYLVKFDLAALYVTPLKRTHQTAAPLNEKLAKNRTLALTVIDDLREIYLGAWEGGISRVKAAEGDPLFDKIWADGEWGHIAGAETTSAFRQRVTKALTRLANAHIGKEIAVFTHQGVIATALEWATQARVFSFSNVAHGSISRLIIGKDYRYIQSFNETGHLDM